MDFVETGFESDQGYMVTGYTLKVSLGITLVTQLLMTLVGACVVMPMKYKNYVRGVPPYKQFKKRVLKVNLWMKVFYAGFYPALFFILILASFYLYVFGMIYQNGEAHTALNYISLCLILDWIVIEFGVNLSLGIFAGCGHKNKCCRRITVTGDCLKGLRNASL